MTDLLTFIHKTVIGFKPIQYTPFWCWYRLICHQGFRLDDRFLYQDFWNSINEGQAQMIDDHKWLTYFGAKPERIILPKEDYDALVQKLNEPSDPKVIERLKELMSKPAPWETDNDLVFKTNGEEKFRIRADQPWYQPRTTEQQLSIEENEE